MERLELCCSVAQGKKLGPFPSTTSSEIWGCWEHGLVFRAHPRTFGTLILNPEETMVPQEPSQSLPPPVSQQHQKTEGLQHIYLLLAPVFLGVIKEKVSSLPIIKAFFFSFWQSICSAEASCCFCSVWHAQVTVLLAL